MSNSAAAWREQGIAAARARDRAGAQEALLQAVRLDPQDEQAWFWLAAVQTEPRQTAYYLERVLEINPENARARAGLDAVRAQLGQSSAAPPTARVLPGAAPAPVAPVPHPAPPGAASAEPGLPWNTPAPAASTPAPPAPAGAPAWMASLVDTPETGLPWASGGSLTTGLAATDAPVTPTTTLAAEPDAAGGRSGAGGDRGGAGGAAGGSAQGADGGGRAR